MAEKTKRKVKFLPVLVFFAAMLACAGLLWTGQKVQEAEKKRDHLLSQIELEEKNIHVLRAEWEYLNNPARIEALAREFLAYDMVDQEQKVSSPASLPDSIQPVRPVSKPFFFKQKPVQEEAGL